MAGIPNFSLIDAIETENYRAAEILHRAPHKISRASREQVYSP